MAIPPWRLRLQPASYNSVPFKVDADSKGSGRRIVQHEWPKKNIPYAEDMGRRIRKFTIAAYIISGPRQADYEANRDDLIAQLETEGAGILIHPTFAQDSGLPVVVDTYTVTEKREKGGFCEIEINFVEAGQPAFSSPLTDTQGVANSAAQSGINQFQQSPDVTGLTST
jgi:prophage DNA circulation protein